MPAHARRESCVPSRDAPSAAADLGGGRLLAMVLLAGLLLRFLGIGWGLPSSLIPGDLLYVRQTFTVYERSDRASAG